MDEIKQALKDIVLKFLLFVKESISLKLVACIAVAVIAWTQAGQAGGVSTLIAQIITAIAGLGYVATKAVQNAIVIKNGGVRPKAPVVIEAAPEPKTEFAKAYEEVKPLPPVVLEKPFDVKAFHERVLSDTGTRYGEVNPFTVFAEARDKGTVTTCYGIKQAQDYWDYLVPLAYAARDDVKERTEKAKGACKGVDAPEYVLMQSQLARILQHRDNVYRLADVPWDRLKYSLDVNDTLYLVGVLSEDLLRTYCS